MALTSKRLVLIVEYDVWMRWTLSALFEQAGFEVVCASNGIGGLRHAIELKPRLIVVGGRLPEISPGELIEELRLVYHSRGLHIVTVDAVLRGGMPEIIRPRAAVAPSESAGNCSTVLAAAPSDDMRAETFASAR